MNDPMELRFGPGSLKRNVPFAIALICGLFFALPVVGEQQTPTQLTPEQLTAGDSNTDILALEQQLRDAETAFAASFNSGNMEAFASFLSEHAVFMGGSTPLRGRQAIVERWTRLRGTGEAPFSWRPERVAVEADGRLGLSSGPVLSPEGTWTSSFVSTWKRTAQGWRVILDVGPRCPPLAPPSDE